MDFKSKLLHTSDLYIRGAIDQFAQYTYTLTNTLGSINCLIWGSKTRMFKDVQPQSADHNIDFKVIVLSDLDVNLGDQIRNAKDSKGVSIFDSAEVIRITPVIHKEKGFILKEIDVVMARG